MTPGVEVRCCGAGVRMSFVQKKSWEIEGGQRREQNLELHGRRGRMGWGLVRYHLGGSGGGGGGMGCAKKKSSSIPPLWNPSSSISPIVIEGRKGGRTKNPFLYGDSRKGATFLKSAKKILTIFAFFRFCTKWIELIRPPRLPL